jgi:hypothetical protein
VEFSLNGFPNSAVCVSGFHGEDCGIVGLNAVSLADTMFNHSQLVWMIQSDVLLMLL